MKYSFVTSTVFALAATLTAADDSSCWLTLGAYSPGGTYCVAPLPSFSDHAGCENSVTQCQAEYAQCQSTTQSTSACLQLFSHCNIESTYCDKFCVADSNGNYPNGCSLDHAISWDGITYPSSTPVAVAPAVITPVVVIKPTTTAPAVYYTPPTYYKPSTPSVAPAANYAPDVPCGTCYTDGSNNQRGLSVQKFAAYGIQMSIPVCMSLCAGYKYSAVEYSSECWCGNALLNNAQPSNQCAMPCNGDKSTTCGGSWLFNIWQEGCTAPVAPVVKSTPVYVAPVVKSTPAPYVAPTPVKSTPVAYVAPKATPTAGVCQIPAAYATAVGGYKAPLVACSTQSDYQSSPWKLYANSVSSVYPSNQVVKACQDACNLQYQDCSNEYAVPLNTGSTTSYSSGYNYHKARRGLGAVHNKRTYGSYVAPTYSYTSAKDTYSSALTKCKAQQTACLAANSAIAPQGTCGANGVFTASKPSTNYASSSNYGSSSSSSYTAPSYSWWWKK